MQIIEHVRAIEVKLNIKKQHNLDIEVNLDIKHPHNFDIEVKSDIEHASHLAPIKSSLFKIC